MSVLVFGETGQVARSLQVTQPDNLSVAYLSRQACDLTDPDRIPSALNEQQPQMIINADATARTRFLEAGFVEVLTKPLNLQGLSATLAPFYNEGSGVQLETH